MIKYDEDNNNNNNYNENEDINKRNNINSLS
jgi:hypothetical protein